MATLITNRFSSYQLTEQEELRGSVFSLEQKWVLQNELAKCATSKSALKYDAAQPSDFIQQEAFFTGQIELIEYLLANSDAAEQRLTELARES